MREVWVLTRTAFSHTIVIGVFASRALVQRYLYEHFGNSDDPLSAQRGTYWTIENDSFVFTVERSRLIESLEELDTGQSGD